jgi:hypothetical protein
MMAVAQAGRAVAQAGRAVAQAGRAECAAARFAPVRGVLRRLTHIAHHPERRVFHEVYIPELGVRVVAKYCDAKLNVRVHTYPGDKLVLDAYPLTTPPDVTFCVTDLCDDSMCRDVACIQELILDFAGTAQSQDFQNFSEM